MRSYILWTVEMQCLPFPREQLGFLDRALLRLMIPIPIPIPTGRGGDEEGRQRTLVSDGC